MVQKMNENNLTLSTVNCFSTPSLYVLPSGSRSMKPFLFSTGVRLRKKVGQAYSGIFVSFSSGGIFSVLNRLRGAELNTGKALFTTVQPVRSPLDPIDILLRTIPKITVALVDGICFPAKFGRE
jgi:hypothetical protein